MSKCPQWRKEGLSSLTLEALAAEDGASAVPYSDAAAQDALYNSSVKGAHSESSNSVLSLFVEEVETLLTSTEQ